MGFVGIRRVLPVTCQLSVDRSLSVQILTFSSLYPNNVDSSHGVFVERRLRELISRTTIQSTVISPVPWFPFRGRIFGRFGESAAVIRRDRRYDVDIIHNRYPVIPKIGMNLAPGLMARASRRVFRECVMTKSVALVDAHYFYPDGVAASMLAKECKLPYLVTARGSDINLIACYASPRKQMLEAAYGASALIAVSEALADAMRNLGMPGEKIHVLRNGVDLEFFCPGDEKPATRESASGSSRFLSVGALKYSKGHDIAIRFIHQLPQSRLVIAGRGPAKAALLELTRKLGVSDRVTFTGTLDTKALRAQYRRADALILMSEREGMPNVILESLACGTPVLATPVGGIPELLTESCCGEMVSARSAEGLAAAWRTLSSRGTHRDRLRQFAMRFSWQDTIAGLQGLMTDKALKN